MVEYSYDVAMPVGLVRLYAGDTDPDGLNRTGGDRTRTDREIAALLSGCDGDARLAAAALLEGRASEFAATAGTIVEGDLRQDFRLRSRRLLEAAQALRAGDVPMVRGNPASAPAPFSSGDGGTMDGW